MSRPEQNPTEQIPTRRRDLFAFGGAAVLTAAMRGRARADTSDSASPTAPVQQFDSALLAAMRAGDRTPFAQRYRALAPVIEQVFDLDAILARSVGLSWATLPSQQKAPLAAAFERYTVSSYVSNFNSYDGQNFQVASAVRPVGDGEVVVHSQLLRTNRSPVTLDYVMRRDPAGWRVVDVLLDGSISRVAEQRSDFRELLATGGVPALAASLQNKVANLSGGMVG
jgi:phospholipid transport system substrate-binding protein